MKTYKLRKLAYQSLLDLSTDDGINASGRDEIYGCIFGRDSALTILKILRAHSLKPSLELLEISRRSLLRLTTLQGKEFNIESGEEPGKFIHEFRKDRYQYEHLLNLEKPWYIYPDLTLRNYDSIDSTPLTLIALYKYYQIIQDGEFLMQVLPSVEAGLNWIITFGDRDKDSLIEYELPKERVHGGLVVQSWTDSHESLRRADGSFPQYPIAPVEAQGYAWLALKLWSDFYKQSSNSSNYRSANYKFAKKLLLQAEKMKKTFNRLFIYREGGRYFASQALDGDKNQIKTVTGNSLILLWATYFNGKDKESIIDDKYVKDLVDRSFEDDLFDKDGGIRTMSSKAETFNSKEDSYHNGSFWPILNGLIHEGLINWNFKKQAQMLHLATLKPMLFFNSPIELYVKTETGYCEFKSSHGQVGCRVQAWSAATLLELATLSSENSWNNYLEKIISVPVLFYLLVVQTMKFPLTFLRETKSYLFKEIE